MILSKKIINIIMILISLSIYSCSKKEEPVVELEDIVITTSISDFGGVLLGQEKSTVITVVNKTKSDIPLNLTISDPFLLSSLSQECVINIIKVNQSCMISIKFIPDVYGVFETEIPIGNKKVKLKGVGLQNGYLFVEDSSWSMGSFKAGVVTRKVFEFNNLGDVSVSSPVFSLPSFIQVGLNRCGNIIPTKAKCQITLEATIPMAGTHNGQIPYSSVGGGSGIINYTADVTPNGASGLISFNTTPLKMEATGEEFLFVSKPIKDFFGNIVPIGTKVYLTLNSNLISLDGTVFETDSSGVVQFRLRTITIKGEGNFSINAGQASGYISFPIVAGQAFGNITVQPFTNNIPANGQTQTVITTNIIHDQYNNIIEDGTEVIFEVVGDGKVGTGTSPELRKTVAISGTAFARFTAGTLASNVIVKIYSGPIKNQFDEIVGYKANGQTTVNQVPGPAFGTFVVTTNVNSIYSNNNPPEGSSLPTQAIVSIGPIKDQYNNIVKNNTAVNVSITNGFNVSGVYPEENTIIYTDSNGRASFILTGANKRGTIGINVSSSSASAYHSIWGYEKSRIKYETLSEKVKFSMLHYDASENPNVDIHWDTIKDGVPMGSLDSITYGYLKYSDRATTKFGMSDSFPYFNWDCTFPAGTYLIFNFCMQSDGLYSPMYKYSQSFSIINNAPQTTDVFELVQNGDFTTLKGISFWNDFESIVGKSTGVKHSPSLTGTLWIDNALYVDPYDSTKKKNFAVSSPITVDPLKKYVLLFTIKEMIGTTDNSHLSLGYIKENGDPSLPNYVLGNPIILKDDYSSNSVGIQQRLVFIPQENSSKIRLYFSTKGTGNSADIKLDDISLKEYSTQNIHDLTSTDGVSVAYMEKYDQAVMFGGTTGIQNSQTSYTTINSGQTTVLSRILDQSTGVVLAKYPANTSTDIGTKPSARGYMSMANSDEYVFAYGGLNLSSSSSAKDDFYMWDGENIKWSKLSIQKDLNVLDPFEQGLGSPGKRYQNGLLYIPELNNIYLMGGLKQDNELETLWYSMDDLWKIDMNQSIKNWKLICSICNIVPSNIYSNVAQKWQDLQSNPSDERLSSYVDSAKNMKNINSFWHSATQKAYFYIPESSYFKQFNPFTELFEEMNINGVYDLRGSYQIEYNSNIGRTYGYSRGESNSSQSKIFFWDMNRDQKQYVKVTFNLENQAKTYIKEFKINLYANGESKTYRPEGTITEAGVDLHLFNYQTMNWQKVGSNTSGISSVNQTPISFLVNDYTVSEFVSLDGKVSALVSPKGRPGFSGGDPLMGDSLSFVQLKDVSGQLEEYKSIYTGAQTTCGILMNDTVKCWGRNSSGQLGQGIATESIGESANEMATINAINIFNSNDPYYAGVTVNQITIGGSHVCALLSNNEVKCWGDNMDGKLGNGVNPVDSKIAYGDGVNEMGSNLPIANLFNSSNNYKVLKIDAGQNHTCALIKVGTVGTINRLKCWGNNQYGQLGNGTNNNYGYSLATVGDNLPFVQGILSFYDVGLGITRNGSIKDFSVGNNHTCAVVETVSGTDALQCWGLNSMGQLSSVGNDLTNKNLATTTSIPSVEIFKLKLGGDHACMTYNDGSFDKFYCFGKNNYGQLGRGGGGIVSSELMKNGDFSNALIDWGTVGSIIPSITNGVANFSGAGNGLTQTFTSVKEDKFYSFKLDLKQNTQTNIVYLINNSLNWERMSGVGSGNGLSINIGHSDSESVSRVRSLLISNGMESLRNYTYRFKISDADGTPYFKIIDKYFNIIYTSELLNEGQHTVSFDLKSHQSELYIDWYAGQYQSAKITDMELYKNPISTLPINIAFYKNVGFGWEIFDYTTVKDTGTFRYDIVPPSTNIMVEIISDPNFPVYEQVQIDNISLKLKDDVLIDLPVDLDFEFIDYDKMFPVVSNQTILDEAFIPKDFYPNFRALNQKMLQFDSNKQNRIELENYIDLNLGTNNFIFEMEIDPKGLGIRRPLLSKIGLSPIVGKINNTGGWAFYIDQNRRLTFFVDGKGVVAESQPIELGFQKIRVLRTVDNSVNKVKIYRDVGLGWSDITISGNLSNGSLPPNIEGFDFSKNTEAPFVIGSTFDDSALEGEQRAFGHYEGSIGYVYFKKGTDSITFVEGIMTDTNILADFTDIGGAAIPDDFDLGDNHTCVLIDNNAKCFGDNVGGQLGYGQGIDEYGISLEQMGFNLPNVDIGIGLEIKSISSGGEFNCVILMDDTAKCWGRNSLGQLGINTNVTHGRGKDNVMGTNEIKIDYIDLEGIF